MTPGEELRLRRRALELGERMSEMLPKLAKLALRVEGAEGDRLLRSVRAFSAAFGMLAGLENLDLLPGIIAEAVDAFDDCHRRLLGGAVSDGATEGMPSSLDPPAPVPPVPPGRTLH